MKLSVVITAAFFFFLSCGENSFSSDADTLPDEDAVLNCEWEDDGRPEELENLGCPDDHKILAGEPLTSALPAHRSTLFLIEKNNENKVHFFDSVKWRHYTFSHDKLEGYPDMMSFNSEMYYSQERRLMLGTVTHFIGQDIYVLEIAPVDKASPEMIKETYEIVKAHFKWEADLRYHPTSTALEMEDRLPEGVPVIKTEDLYEGAVYQGLNLGKSIGRLRFVKMDELEDLYVGRMEIVVIDHVPNDISAVAGLITAEFQTPLAHVNLLSRNRGTPNMALIGAFDNEELRSYEGKWVELEVKADLWSMKHSSQESAESFWKEKRPSETQTPEIDRDFGDIINVRDADITWIPKIGGKAAHFAEMTKISPAIPLPEAFAIPFLYYLDFIKSSGLEEEIKALLTEEKFKNDGTYRMIALNSLRDKIKSSSVSTELIKAVEDVIDEYFPGIKVRFRSSSNAEDLEQFNGAGLYTSKSYEPGNPNKTIEKTILKVWASLWSLAAFEEREWAKVDHFSTGMAVLIHRSFPDEIEKANGVAITANPFDPPPEGTAAYYVNVQDGATSVANPEPGITTDSFLFYKPPAGQGEMTYLSYSSLTDGENVLSFEETVSLVKSLKQIHEHFYKIYKKEPFGMDIEFKLIDDDRNLVIKQARPYPF